MHAAVDIKTVLSEKNGREGLHLLMAKFGNMNPYDAAVPVRDAFERPEQMNGKKRAKIQMCD